jgi:hypothetical protein
LESVTPTHTFAGEVLLVSGMACFSLQVCGML